MSLMLSHGCGNGFPIETGMNWCIYYIYIYIYIYTYIYISLYIPPMFRQTQFQQVPPVVFLSLDKPFEDSHLDIKPSQVPSVQVRAGDVRFSKQAGGSACCKLKRPSLAILFQCRNV